MLPYSFSCLLLLLGLAAAHTPIHSHERKSNPENFGLVVNATFLDALVMHVDVGLLHRDAATQTQWKAARHLQHIGAHNKVNHSLNPCHTTAEGVTCFPYFFLLGVPKGGTTTMAKLLRCHNQIMNTRKEPHFWTRPLVQDPQANEHYPYKDQTRELLAMNKGNHIATVFGDYSASTFWEWETSDLGMDVSVPVQIHSILPQAKLIVMIRDPVSRLASDWSYFNFVHRASPTPKDETLRELPDLFHEHAVRKVQGVVQCFLSAEQQLTGERPRISWDLYNCLRGKNGERRRHPGLYILSLKLWRAVFPSDSLLVLRSEDFFENPIQQAKIVIDFVGLPSTDYLTHCENLQKESARSIKFSMRNDTRILLQNLYAPFNKALARELHDERFLYG